LRMESFSAARFPSVWNVHDASPIVSLSKQSVTQCQTPSIAVQDAVQTHLMERMAVEALTVKISEQPFSVYDALVSGIKNGCSAQDGLRPPSV